MRYFCEILILLTPLSQLLRFIINLRDRELWRKLESSDTLEIREDVLKKIR